MSRLGFLDMNNVLKILAFTLDVNRGISLHMSACHVPGIDDADGLNSYLIGFLLSYNLADCDLWSSSSFFNGLFIR